MSTTPEQMATALAELDIDSSDEEQKNEPSCETKQENTNTTNDDDNIQTLAAPAFVFGAAASGSGAQPFAGGLGSATSIPKSTFSFGSRPSTTSAAPGNRPSPVASAWGDSSGERKNGRDQKGSGGRSNGERVTFGAHGSTRQRQTKTPQRRSPKNALTDYAAVQTKLNTVKEKLKNAATAKDYVAAGELQSQQKRLEEQFKTVYQAHQQNLKDKLQQRRSNNSPSIMPAQEMEQIRIKVWADYIQRTFTPNLQLAVDQLLDIVQRRMTVAATKGVHFVDVCSYVSSGHEVSLEGEELKIMHTVMTSRVALSNFSWQLFMAGYQPSCQQKTDCYGDRSANQWIVRIRMLRSFEKLESRFGKMYGHNFTLEKEFVNYFERDCQPKGGLPATDVVSKAKIQGNEYLVSYPNPVQ